MQQSQTKWSVRQRCRKNTRTVQLHRGDSLWSRLAEKPFQVNFDVCRLLAGWARVSWNQEQICCTLTRIDKRYFIPVALVVPRSLLIPQTEQNKEQKKSTLCFLSSKGHNEGLTELGTNLLYLRWSQQSVSFESKNKMANIHMSLE